jgi:CDP-diacylglycerol--glycerol-3-phosphate 3-phosphatidyltransferase
VNLPNTITLARIGCVPLLLWTLTHAAAAPLHGHQEAVAAAIFLLASLTDGVDGVLARRLHQVTTLGTVLSPLADKLMVSAAFISLARFAPALVPAWIVVLIVAREFLVTGLSSVAAQEKMSLRVREIGKFKTVMQIVSVMAVLAAHAQPRWFGSLPGTSIAIGAIWLMLAVSLLSALAYLRAFLREVVLRSRGVPAAAVDQPNQGNVRAT